MYRDTRIHVVLPTYDVMFSFILLLVIFLGNLPLASYELMSPDASGYLDIGRNLFSGNGAVSSYNISQFWAERYHPSLPYMPPIYPIVAGFIYSFLNLKAVIGFNILLLSLNCVLLYLIIRMEADYFTSFFIALWMGFSVILVRTAIFPWTEHLHLFFLFLAIYIYLKYKGKQFLVGVLLAICSLIRAASFYNVLGLAIALAILIGFSKASLKEYIKMALGFLIIFIPYEMFCYLRYGVFYPEYFAASKDYLTAQIFPGAFYKMGFPVLNAPSIRITTDIILTNILNHFADFLKAFGVMSFVLVLIPFYIVFYSLRRKNFLLTIFLFQGLCIIIGSSLSLWWLPSIDADRYSLIPFITLGTIGFLSITEITKRLFAKRYNKIPIIVIAIIFAIFFLLEIKDSQSFRNHYIKNNNTRTSTSYRRDTDEIYRWIRANTEKNDLIASLPAYFSDTCLFERPFVSLPQNKASTIVNLKDFLDIYKPEYILIPRILLIRNVGVINVLKGVGFVEKKKVGALVLLKCQNGTWDQRGQANNPFSP